MWQRAWDRLEVFFISVRVRGRGMPMVWSAGPPFVGLEDGTLSYPFVILFWPFRSLSQRLIYLSSTIPT